LANLPDLSIRQERGMVFKPNSIPATPGSEPAGFVNPAGAGNPSGAGNLLIRMMPDSNESV